MVLMSLESGITAWWHDRGNCKLLLVLYNLQCNCRLLDFVDSTPMFIILSFMIRILDSFTNTGSCAGAIAVCLVFPHRIALVTVSYSNIQITKSYVTKYWFTIHMLDHQLYFTIYNLNREYYKLCSTVQQRLDLWSEKYCTRYVFS